MVASGHVHAKSQVRDHWEADPCGARLSASPPGTAAFFADVTAARYAQEPFIPAFADFGRWRGRDVLEIGVGIGTDFVAFARAGARLRGIDLTESATALVRRRLELEQLTAEVDVGDAEALAFPDGSFDLVYSWGVLHHTPQPERALAEIRRVLRPGGEARIMLYSRRSWVAFGLWLRYAFARGRLRRTLDEVVSQHMESPGTKAYTQSELEALFVGFREVEFSRWVTPYDRRVAGPLTRLGGSRLGWFVGIRARV